MRIPLVDLSAQYEALRGELEPIVLERLRACDYVGGASVKTFERSFATYCGARHAIGCGNGTDAIELLVRAAGLSRGDEVIIPASTFIATAVALMRAEVRPVVVDCEAGSAAIDVSSLEPAITPRTRAIMPVWLYGEIANHREIEAIAAKHNLAMFEDASQAHGATLDGVRAGALGRAAAFSLYPGKNLGAAGDAGVIVTSDDALAESCRALRNYGSEVRYEHPRFGYNSRLDTMQAAILSVKLRHLDAWNEARRRAAARYDARLSRSVEVERPRLTGASHVFHLYVVRVPNRDFVLQRLHAREIGAAIHYPVPVHLHGATRSLGYAPGSFPNAERRAREILSLPIYPEITDAQIDEVCDSLQGALR